MPISEPLKAQIERELRMTGPGLLEGWVTPEKGIVIAELVVENKPEICVEIGVFGGRSLIATALALRENHHGKVYGIDPWKTDACLEGDQDQGNKDWWSKVDLHAIHKGCMEAIWRLGLDARAIVIRSTSEHAVSLFKRIDFFVLDGNHSEVASCRDVERFCPKMKVGAYMVFDDTDWPTTKKAQELALKWCDEIKDNGSWKLYRRK